MSELVVLAHAARREIWEPVLATLEERHNVSFLDVPGFGDSPLPVGPPSIEAMGAAIVETLAARELSGAHLVGVSMAGSVALEAARSGTIAGATVISPAGFWTTREAATIMAEVGGLWALVRAASPLVRLGGRSTYLRGRVWDRVVAQPSRVPRDVADAMILGLARNMRHITARPQDLAALTRAIVGYRVRPLDGNVRVTVAWGDRDIFTPYSSHAVRARDVLPEARHVTLYGCGHLPFFDDPDQVARVLHEAVGE